MKVFQYPDDFSVPEGSSIPAELHSIREAPTLQRVEFAHARSAWLFTRCDEIKSVRVRFDAFSATIGFDQAFSDDMPWPHLGAGASGAGEAPAPRWGRLPRIKGRRLAGHVAEIATALTARDLLYSHRTAIDAVSDYSAPATQRFAAGLLGVDRQAWTEAFDLHEALIDPNAPPSSWAACRKQLSHLATRVLERSLAQSQNTPVRELAIASRSASMTTEQAVGSCGALLFAATHLLVNPLVFGICALLHEADQLDDIRSGKSSWEDAAQEVLRFHGYGHLGLPRTALKDVTVRNTAIAAGDIVIPSPLAASRDSRMFLDADTFKIRRPAGLTTSAWGDLYEFLEDSVTKAFLTSALRSFFETFPQAACTNLPQYAEIWSGGLAHRPRRLNVAI